MATSETPAVGVFPKKILTVKDVAQISTRNKKKAKKPAKYTVEEAFNFLTIDSSTEGPVDGSFHRERCIRAVAFLLHYCGEREDVQSPIIANGLGYVLETCAADMARVEARRQIERGGAQ